MGYNFTVKNGFRPKANGRYPWPAMKATPPLPDRTIELGTDDVLTHYVDADDGQKKWMVHTGIGCFGILLKDEEVEPIDGDTKLRLL